MSDPTPDRGFVRVACPACGNGNVWFTCNQCKKSDHFAMHADHVDCDCGATYSHGTCTCGADVGLSDLVFVAYDEGPLALADLEIAWGRVAVLALVVLAVLAGITTLLFS